MHSPKARPDSSGDGKPMMATRPPCAPLGEQTLVNISVWQDLESLSHYVYR